VSRREDEHYLVVKARDQVSALLGSALRSATAGIRDFSQELKENLHANRMSVVLYSLFFVFCFFF